MGHHVVCTVCKCNNGYDAFINPRKVNAMTEQDLLVKSALAANPALPLLSSSIPEEKENWSALQGERKQWITDLKLQMEMRDQAARTCGKIGRRQW